MSKAAGCVSSWADEFTSTESPMGGDWTQWFKNAPTSAISTDGSDAVFVDPGGADYWTFAINGGKPMCSPNHYAELTSVALGGTDCQVAAITRASTADSNDDRYEGGHTLSGATWIKFIIRVVGGTETVLLWAAATTQESTTSVKLVSNGDQHTLYINGTEEATVTDDVLTAGVLTGFRFRGYAGAEVTHKAGRAAAATV